MKSVTFFRMKSICAVMLVALAVLVGSCSKENGGTVGLPGSFKWITEINSEQPVFVAVDTPLKLEYAVENVKSVTVGELPQGWTATVDEAAGSVTLTATAQAEQKVNVQVKVLGADDKEVVESVALYCLNSFDNPKGTFVLNEGNMTTENGSLTYITPEGYVIADAYKAVNGTELGNVAQDMAFCNGKIYVIAQNGDLNAVGTKFENDGMLVVMDAKTLKKEAALSKTELADLDWPTHIAVLDDQHIYIRDNAMVRRLDLTTKTLHPVSGTDNAPKSQFVVTNGKVYTYKAGSISGLLEISADNDAAKSILFPFKLTYQINSVLGMKAADNGEFWVMGFGFGKTFIGKFDPTTKKMTQKLIGVKPFVGASGVTFANKGNKLYYADGTTIYCLNFDAAEGEEAESVVTDLNNIDVNAGMLYNGISAHPVTGLIYINTIKGFAQFTQNQIWAFDFDANAEEPVAKYENYTHFPAGFFFYPEAK